MDFSLDFSYGDNFSGQDQVFHGLGSCKVDHIDFGATPDALDYQTTPPGKEGN